MKLLYKDCNLLDPTLIKQTTTSLNEYREHLLSVSQKNNYDDLECSINLPFDSELLTNVLSLKQKKQNANLKYIVVIGIGGSNLGTKAIYDALYGYYDTLQPDRFPKMIFLDTQDEEVLTKTKDLFQKLQSKEEFLINAISKSGGTTETASNLEVLYEELTKKFGDINDRIVFTTDNGSKMHDVAQKMNIDVLTIPTLVGGRYSVFSAVGLFPLALLGINVEALLSGAKTTRTECLNANENPALISATILYLHWKAGKNINDNFIFLPQLESLGKWYRQLMGESIGKDGKGITPTVSIGSTDLHSVGQLYLGGPKDKITTFIYGENTKFHVNVPGKTAFNLVDTIPSKNIHTIMNAIVVGTQTAYKNQSLPYLSVVFNTVSEESLGSFMQFKMIEMMYLGHLMEVSTFDQPHVELYKKETKRLLQE